ncbi:MAG: hypothetical protein KAS95_08075 [Candidatus Heimdallarchaeota archaeon]|nr:hypothetical protein [Candidatus Heimdallarchaeota archaeon]
MSFMIRRVYEGLLFKPDNLTVHPLIGLIIVFVQFGFLIPNNKWLLMLLLIFIIVETAIYGNIKGGLSLLWAIFPLIIFLGGITYWFGGPAQTYRVLMRLIIGALGFSLFFAITNPSDLFRALEKIRFPSKIAIIPSLALTMAPRIAKDAEETYNTLEIRGEIKGFFLRWLPRMLAIFVASLLYRSEYLAHSLYYRGFSIQKRTHYKKQRFTKVDFFRILTWVIFVIVFYIILHFGWLNNLT